MTEPAAPVQGLTFRLTQRLDAVEVLPKAVRQHVCDTLLNVMGCAVAGARHSAMGMARRALVQVSGAGSATVIGHASGVEPHQAALLNAMAAAVHSYDDTHADTLVHPGGPVAFALLALAQVRPLRGDEFLLAYALGVELACRLSKALACPPAVHAPGWIQNGVVTGAGAALATAKALRLGPAGMAQAVGIALTGAAGVRALSKGMCFSLMSGQSAEAGLRAALLAEQGFGSAADVLEAEEGVLAMYSMKPHPGHLVADLGTRYELMDNLCKPYPCGVVLHPAIDACLALVAQEVRPAQIQTLRLTLAPASARLGNHPHPSTPEQATMSLQHWAALSLLDGQAGLAQTEPRRLADPQLAELRHRVALAADPGLARESARLEVALHDGQVLALNVAHCRGSRGRPMTHEEVLHKFKTQCESALAPADTERLRQACLGLDGLGDVAELVAHAGRAWQH